MPSLASIVVAAIYLLAFLVVVVAFAAFFGKLLRLYASAWFLTLLCGVALLGLIILAEPLYSTFVARGTSEQPTPLWLRLSIGALCLASSGAAFHSKFKRAA